MHSIDFFALYSESFRLNEIFLFSFNLLLASSFFSNDSFELSFLTGDTREEFDERLLFKFFINFVFIGLSIFELDDSWLSSLLIWSNTSFSRSAGSLIRKISKNLKLYIFLNFVYQLMLKIEWFLELNPMHNFLDNVLIDRLRALIKLN